MDALLIAVRYAIAVLFLAGAVGKLSDLAATRRAIAGFGVPEQFAVALGVLLPLTELATAVGLAVRPVSWWAAAVAAILLTGFVAAIAANLYQGRAPDCRCFGRLRSAPIGPGTLAINLLLLSGALLLLAQPGGDSDLDLAGLVATLTPAQWLMGGAIALLACVSALSVWLLLQLFRQQGRLLQRIEQLEVRSGEMPKPVPELPVPSPPPGLSPGTPAPTFEVDALVGGRTNLAGLLARGKPVLMVFMDPGCAPSTAMLPALARWHADPAARLTVAILSRGTPEANRRKLADLETGPFLLQQDREVANAYRCADTPGAVLIRADGRIASPVAQGACEIESLVAQRHELLGEMTRPLQQGAPVPDQAFLGPARTADP